jgi:hypothetical protein
VTRLIISSLCRIAARSSSAVPSFGRLARACAGLGVQSADVSGNDGKAGPCGAAQAVIVGHVYFRP